MSNKNKGICALRYSSDSTIVFPVNNNEVLISIFEYYDLDNLVKFHIPNTEIDYAAPFPHYIFIYRFENLNKQNGAVIICDRDANLRRGKFFDSVRRLNIEYNRDKNHYMNLENITFVYEGHKNGEE